MDKTRIKYSKTGKAKYISHLDLMTTMQRAFIRAGAKLKYSEGFNPHPYVSVALPLSVGTESLCEVMDAALGGGIPRDINGFLPEGLKVLKTYRAWRSFDDIKWICMECKIGFDEEPAPVLDDMLAERFAAQSLFITKKTKRGISTIDVAPYIRDAAVSRDVNNSKCVVISAKFSAQNPTINSKDIEHIIEGIYADNCENIVHFNNIETKRIELYDKDMILFK